MAKNPKWQHAGALGVATTDADALVAELQRREQQLRESQRIAHIGSWEWDLATDQIEWSEELFRIWGLDPGEPFSYDAYLNRLQPDDRERMQKLVTQAIETRSAYVVEHRIVLADGTERWILGRGTVVCDEHGTPVKLRGTAQDITDRRNAEERALALFREQYERERAEREREELRQRAEELAALAAALEQSNRELDAFAYAASHDLRAPLRGIANLAQWIEEDLQDSLSEDTRGMLALMRTRMHRMESLIEGILQYSRAGRAHEKPVSVDVGRLVRETVDLLAPESAIVSVQVELPVIVSELTPLRQVFQNLIGNAIKHGGPGVHIDIEARDAGAFWEFSVTDNGPGVPAEYQERIWGIFQTLDARDRVEGTGIGLSLVKKLVEAQGGQVGVTSSPDSGARFWFWWRKTATWGGSGGQGTEHSAGRG
jgi:PAS domain S-box-containing protein